MAGLNIPIGGDLAPFLAVAESLKAEMAKISASIAKSTEPVRAAAGKASSALETVKATASSTKTGFTGLLTKAGDLGFALTNIVSGAKAIRSVFGFLKNLPPQWKKVAIAATAVVAAVGAVVIAIKGLKAIFSSLLTYAGKVWRGIAAGASSAARSVKSLFSGITSAIPGGGFLGPLAGIASAAGAIALAYSSLRTGMDVAGNIEQTSIALEALTGSGDVAKKMMEEMKQTWLTTGASIEEQSGSIRKFIALGFSPEGAMQLQKNLMDVGGAVGMTTAETSLLASALAQVKAKGVVSMEELRQQIAEKGIPVFDALANKLGVTKAALIDMVSDGKVPAEQLLDIFMNMEGPFAKFKGGAERMGYTFVGMTARLKGAWKLFLAEFAAPILDNLKPIMDAFMSKLEGMKAKAAALGKSLGDAILAAFVLIRDGKTTELFARGFVFAITAGIDLLIRGIRSAVAYLSGALPPIFQGAAMILKDPLFFQGVSEIFEGIGQKMAAGFGRATGMMSEDVAEEYSKAGTGSMTLGTRMIASSGNGVSLGDILTEALKKGEAAAEGSFGEMGEGAKKAKAEFVALLASTKQAATALRASTAVPKAPDVPDAPVTATAAPVAKKLEAPMVLTTALGRIGGGGFGMSMQPMVTEQRKTNLKLDAIIKNTASSGLTLAPIV